MIIIVSSSRSLFIFTAPEGESRFQQGFAPFSPVRPHPERTARRTRSGDFVPTDLLRADFAATPRFPAPFARARPAGRNCVTRSGIARRQESYRGAIAIGIR